MSNKGGVHMKRFFLFFLIFSLLLGSVSAQEIEETASNHASLIDIIVDLISVPSQTFISVDGKTVDADCSLKVDEGAKRTGKTSRSLRLAVDGYSSIKMIDITKQTTFSIKNGKKGDLLVFDGLDPTHTYYWIAYKCSLPTSTGSGTSSGTGSTSTGSGTGSSASGTPSGDTTKEGFQIDRLRYLEDNTYEFRITNIGDSPRGTNLEMFYIAKSNHFYDTTISGQSNVPQLQSSVLGSDLSKTRTTCAGEPFVRSFTLSELKAGESRTYTGVPIFPFSGSIFDRIKDKTLFYNGAGKDATFKDGSLNVDPNHQYLFVVQSYDTCGTIGAKAVGTIGFKFTDADADGQVDDVDKVSGNTPDSDDTDLGVTGTEVAGTIPSLFYEDLVDSDRFPTDNEIKDSICTRTTQCEKTETYTTTCMRQERFESDFGVALPRAKKTIYADILSSVGGCATGAWIGFKGGGAIGLAVGGLGTPVGATLGTIAGCFGGGGAAFLAERGITKVADLDNFGVCISTKKGDVDSGVSFIDDIGNKFNDSVYDTGLTSKNAGILAIVLVMVGIVVFNSILSGGKK